MNSGVGLLALRLLPLGLFNLVVGGVALYRYVFGLMSMNWAVGSLLSMLAINVVAGYIIIKRS